MKLVTYQFEGAVRHGILGGPEGAESIADLGSGDLSSLLQGGPQAMAAAERSGGPAVPLRRARLLAPVRRPGKVLCVASNYQDHIAEGGGAPLDKTKRVPAIFCKFASQVIGPDDPLPLPAHLTDQTDWEIELAVVMGLRCRRAAPETALGYVGGYTIGNDVSARTFNNGKPVEDYPGRDWFEWLWGKWVDACLPLGPWLVTPDEAGDPQSLGVRLALNGELKQNANTSEMIFSVAEIISFISQFATLEPGDVILTGTPAGTGLATSTFLKPGDVLEGSIDRLGELRTLAIAAQPS
jgi:2-keto-4-pentenoate hydratase/2-oxohepta-3-ene-1,7-dioic acid hydratase in catechol pathway